MVQEENHAADVQQAVRDRYGALARGDVGSRQQVTRELAGAFGYSPEELADIPDAANLGVSCGNPTATAGLKPGEVVVDLGAGAGLDVFLAARKVGPGGKAVGIDMTADMVERARRNAQRAGLTNVEFHLAQIEDLPLPDNSADCVISNCVLNLVPDKPRAFAEIFRVLKPGGRLAVSDIALRQPLPDELTRDLHAHAGCLAGAMLMDDYRSGLEAAGFDPVCIVDSGVDLNVYAKLGDEACCGGDEAGEQDLFRHFRQLTRQYDFNRYAASVKVMALKPGPNPSA